MALTKDHLHALIALQGQDAALDKIKAEMEKIPVQVAALNAGLEKEKARLSEAKARTLTLEKQKKAKELELAAKEEAAKKHGGELNSVKTNEAFRALQKEIDFAKQEAGEIETEILVLMDQVDASRKEEKAAAGEMKGLEDKVKSEAAALEAELARIKGLFDGAQAAREAAASPVPADAMKIYNHIRGRGKKDAVVPIDFNKDSNNCSACRVILAPQVIVEATKAKALVTCESCQRIIYKSDLGVAGGPLAARREELPNSIERDAH